MMLSVPDSYIEAIKFYRNSNPGISLKQAADWYGDFMSDRGLTRLDWNKLSLLDVRNYMELCLKAARVSRFKAIQEMINSFNNDYHTYFRAVMDY